MTTQDNVNTLDIHFRGEKPRRLTFTQKAALHNRMIDILRKFDCEHSQSAADKLQATLKGMKGVKYTGWEACRKELAYEQAKFQLEKEGVL
ncbi:hypothetical protein ACEOXO_000200 [Vibrio cholerae]|nr:hypothetical protein [Vibrio cholerae]EKF9271728.1 hypothetical protein [Vibrio cholerae]EKF9888812.1 hypothetical protein [Vibrio cholerae]